MAFHGRVQGEHFTIYSGDDAKENGDNFAAKQGKLAFVSQRAPLQDRTSCVQNVVKIQSRQPAKQVQINMLA